MALSLNTVTVELISLGREHARRWQKIAALLIRVQDAELWRQGSYRSFTAYLGHLAEESGAQPSVFWRALKAGRIYIDAQERSGSLPPLGQAPGASATGLELLGKISKQAPDELTDELTRKTVEGTVTNEQLRRVWTDIKKSRRAAELNAIDDAAAPTTALILTTLRRVEAGWIGGMGPDSRLELFAEVSPVEGMGEEAVFDLVAVAQPDPFGHVEFHGVKVVLDDRTFDVLEYQRDAASFVNHLWIAAPNEIAGVIRRRSADVGVLAIAGSLLRISREPRQSGGTEDLTGQLAKSLLTHALRWRTKNPVRKRRLSW